MQWLDGGWNLEQAGEYRIPAPREAVWAALNDPEVLARCIEGCQTMERVGDDRFEASVKAKVGPVSATFKADIELTELNPPASYTLKLDVKGGAAGFGKGTARVGLVEDDGATQLSYAVDATVGGKLAQVGSRLIDAAARKMADGFFDQFAEALGGTPQVAESGPAEPDQGDAATAAAQGDRTWVWWVAALVVAALIGALFVAS